MRTIARDDRPISRRMPWLTGTTFATSVAMFDHNVIDGAPAARFVAQLKRLMKRGDGLGEPGPASPDPAV